MSSSRLCTIDSCQQFARVLCICCQQDFCIIHLNEHSDLIQAQLTPVSDKLTKLSDKMDNYNLVRLNSLVEFQGWSKEAHEEIDRFYERKKQEFEEFFTSEQDNQKNEHNRLQNQITKLNKEEGTTQEDIDSINQSIRSFEQQVDQFQHLQLVLLPLVIDEQPITIHHKMSKANNYLPLSDPYQTIDVKNNYFSIAANDHLILVKKDAKLCLFDQQLTVVKEIPWSQNIIVDMCWSKTLAQFLIITFGKIFTLDETSIIMKEISIGSGKSNKWYCGTCTNDNLFLSTLGVSPSIFKYSLLPSIQFVEEYRSFVSCTKDERIQDLSSNNHVLGILIENSRKTVRFDLCSQKTLDRYWSIKLDSLLGLCGSRSCSLKNNEWMIIHPNNSQLLHISASGKIIQKDKYDSSPIHAVQVDNNILAILTENDLRLHKLS